MIRVLEVFDSLEISGGVQGVVMNIFRKMDHQKYAVDFAVYDAPPENSYQDEIQKIGGKVLQIQNLSEAGPMEFYKQFQEIFRREHYDAVHAHNIHHNGLILLAAQNAGIPIRISHSHQAFDERNESFVRKLFADGLKKLNNKVATRKVACSDLAAEFLYGKKSAYEFIPNAVNIASFHIPETKYELRHEYGYQDDKQTILLHIGRFSPQKNQFFFIKMMEKLKEENVILLMAGEGSLKEEFLKAVKIAGLEEKIHYIGLRKDIPRLLKMADGMLLPSIYEGLPVVVVEAQAAGCHCLISDVVTKQADLQEGLVEYLPIGSEIRWVECIKKLKSVKNPVSIDKIHQKMRDKKFDTETNLEAWYDLYEKRS